MRRSRDRPSSVRWARAVASDLDAFMRGGRLGCVEPGCPRRPRPAFSREHRRGAAMHIAVVFVSLVVALAAGGCSRGQQEAARAAAKVTVARPLVREIVEWDEYTG